MIDKNIIKTRERRRLSFGDTNPQPIHGGPKFGPLLPPSRDSICMPSQVWSTDFLFEIFDHVINSRRIRLVQFEQKRWTKAANSNSLRSRGNKSVRIRRFGPFFWFDLGQICRFDEFEYRPICDGMHKLSRDGGGSGPIFGPPSRGPRVVDQL